LAKAGILGGNASSYSAPSADELASRFAAVQISGPPQQQQQQSSQQQQSQQLQDGFAPQGYYVDPSQAYFGGYEQPRPAFPQMGGYMSQPNGFGPAGYGPSVPYGQQFQPRPAPPPMQQFPQGTSLPAAQQAAMQAQRPLPSSNVLPISRQFTAGPGETLIANKLFVGGLSYDLSELELVQAFARYGAQKANIICDRETGRSRGYGFVTFDNELSASEAMNYMQGVDVHGRRIRIGPATARAQTRAYQQHHAQLAQQQMQQQQQQFAQGYPQQAFAPQGYPQQQGFAPVMQMPQQYQQFAQLPSKPAPGYAAPAGKFMTGPSQPMYSSQKDWSSADQGYAIGGGFSGSNVSDYGLGAPLSVDGPAW